MIFITGWVLCSAIVYGIATTGVLEETSSKYKIFCRGLKTIETGTIPFCAISCFMLLRNLNLRTNSIINTIASTTFGIYLLHESTIGRKLLWSDIFKADTIMYRSDYFPILAIGAVMVVFFVCSCIDYLRLRFIEPAMMRKGKTVLSKIKAQLF